MAKKAAEARRKDGAPDIPFMPKEWPAERVFKMKIGDLVPYARNTRTHSPAQIAQLAASIREFGWTIPVLVDEDGEIVAGHGRVLAAHELGIEEVPTMVATGWTDAQKRAYRIADNQLPANAGWDHGLLKTELSDLAGLGFDLSLIGFPDLELTSFLAGLGDGTQGPQPEGASLADRFGIPPFSVLNAREGWWQNRKRAWIDLGIQSELGRGDTAVNTPHEGRGMADGLVAVRDKQKAGRKANAIPGGAAMPLDRKKQGKANATPGGSRMPAADYSKNKARGDGRGRASKTSGK